MSIDQLPDSNLPAIAYAGEAAAAAPLPIDPTNEPASAWWQLFTAFGTWIASCLLLLIFQLLFVVPYLISKGTQQTQQNESLLSDKTFFLLTVISVIPAHILTVFVAWAIVTSWGKRPFWETIRWSWPEQGDLEKRIFLIGLTVVLAMALLALGWFITWKVGGAETEIDQLIKSSVAARIITALLAAATAPFVEELIYRGVLYPAIDRAFGAVWAVIVVSLMFAGVHLLQYHNNIGVVSVIAMLSVTLTLTRAVTGRLFPCFLIHLIFNGIQSIVIVASPYLETLQHRDKTTVGVTLLLEYVIRHLG